LCQSSSRPKTELENSHGSRWARGIIFGFLESQNRECILKISGKGGFEAIVLSGETKSHAFSMKELKRRDKRILPVFFETIQFITNDRMP